MLAWCHVLSVHYVSAGEFFYCFKRVGSKGTGSFFVIFSSANLADETMDAVENDLYSSGNECCYIAIVAYGVSQLQC